VLLLQAESVSTPAAAAATRTNLRMYNNP
jgi:hypothetical protein